MTTNPTPLKDNLLAAGFMTASMAAFTFNDTLMKMMAGDVPLYQLLFLRGVMTTLVVAAIAWRMGAFLTRITRQDAGLLALRSLTDTATAFFFLTALFNMPLANVTAIMQALPLTITLAAWAVLGEPVGWRRFTAIAVGLVGVLLIIRPGTADFTLYSLYGLAAVACVTARDLITRSMSRSVPTMLIVLTNSVAVMVVFGALSLTEDWQVMSDRSWGLITAASVLIIGAYLFATLVMRVGDIAFVAPFRYTGLLWALILGYAVFGDWPTPITLLGAAIVVSSGLFMLWRETQLARAHPSSHKAS
ncbi:MAG: DMT family transporter [Pseudomonadota bacterium]